MKTLSLRASCDLYHGSPDIRKGVDSRAFYGAPPIFFPNAGQRVGEYLRRHKIQEIMDSHRISVRYIDLNWIVLHYAYTGLFEVIFRNGRRSYKISTSEFIRLEGADVLSLTTKIAD